MAKVDEEESPKADETLIHEENSTEKNNGAKITGNEIDVMSPFYLQTIRDKCLLVTSFIMPIMGSG